MIEIKKLFPYIMDPKESEENLTVETIYYINMLKAYDGFPRFASWNWSAFFFGAGWLLYRKMYLYGAIAIVVYILAGYKHPEQILPFSILLGIFGNAIYRLDLEKRVNSNSKKKGTSSLIVWCYVITILALVFFLEYRKHGIEGVLEHLFGTYIK